MYNTGLIIKKPQPQDWRVGSVSGFDSAVLQKDHNWHEYLPIKENQFSRHFDTMGCVSFSALNCLEMLQKRKYGNEVNWSDRWLAKVSGTTRRGNWLQSVADTIRHTGLLLESEYPYPRQEAGFDWDDFYKDVPLSMFEEAGDFLKEYEVTYEWVDIRNRDNLLYSLRFTPLQVTGVFPSHRKAVDGIIPREEGLHTHAYTIYGGKYGEYFDVFDHYTVEKKKIAWDFDLGINAMRYNLTKLTDKPMEKPEIENNTLVQLVEGHGGFGFFLDGDIIIDDLANVLATNEMRNKEQRTKALTQEQWDMFDKVNLKGEPVNS